MLLQDGSELLLDRKLKENIVIVNLEADAHGSCSCWGRGMRGQRREGDLEEKAAVGKDPETPPQGGPPGSGPAPRPPHFTGQ